MSSNNKTPWWLSDIDLGNKMFQKENVNPLVDDTIKACKTLNEKLNVEVKTYNPVGSSGWPTSDIDLLMKPSTDPRVLNTLQTRLVGDDSLNSHIDGATDEDIAASVLPRNVVFSDVTTYMDSIMRSEMEQSVEHPVEQSVEQPKAE